MSDRLDDIRARWAATTPGPWRWTEWTENDGTSGPFLQGRDRRDGTEWGILAVAHDGVSLSLFDQRAIAAAPEDVAWLVASLVGAQDLRATAERERDEARAELNAATADLRGERLHVATLRECVRNVMRVVGLPDDASLGQVVQAVQGDEARALLREVLSDEWLKSNMHEAFVARIRAALGETA